MTDAVYRIEGDVAEASGHAAGPWSADMQHGSAPAALVAWAAERVPTGEPMRVARMTVDLMRPVPIAPLRIASQIIRQGRKIQLCEIRLLAGETEVVRASVLKVRAGADQRPGPIGVEPLAGSNVDLCEALTGPSPGDSPFLDGVARRRAGGGRWWSGAAESTAMWFHAHRPIVAGEQTSPLMRAAVTADFCNGASALLDARQWSFINGDMSLSLMRAPVGPWILLDAQSWIGTDGAGLAFGRLADQQGYFGRAVQSLLIERRAAP